MKSSLLYVLLALILLACNRPESGSANLSYNKDAILLSSAEGFSIQKFNDYKILSVFDPWQKSEGVVFKYLLAKDSAMVPAQLKHLPFIKIPVNRVLTLSTTHIAFIDTLTGINSITGVSGSQYVYDGELRKRIISGDVRDIGYDQSLNYELIIDMEPDVIFMYGVEGTVGSTISKLQDLGLQPVMCGDYLEAHPLGKVEWIKFFGEFYDKGREADIIYRGIDSAYIAVSDLSAGLEKKPAVLSGLPWKNTWYVPGGDSFAARLIEDAGGNYLWSDDNSEEAIPLDLESVYLKAMEADIWINPGDVSTLDELYKFDERFRHLSVLSDGQVFNNHNRINNFGGNDYWESGALRPDLIIADLFKIFHPELSRDHELIYYSKLK